MGGKVLGINGIRLVGHLGGVGRCIEAILGCLDELEHPFDRINIYTPAPIDDEIQLPRGAGNIVLPSFLPGGLWEQIILPRALTNEDLLLCPSYVAPLATRCPILLIHHGSYEGYPEGFSWWEINKARIAYTLSAKKATVVSTVSEHSKRSITHYYGIDPEKIRVIPEGVDTTLFCPIDDDQKLSDWRRQVFGEDTSFLLYVGKPAKRRNLPALIRAFGQLKEQRHLPHKLLLIGTELTGSTFEFAIEEMNLRREVFTIGFASHEEIAVAYNASDLLVYPSSYEGFGMPVLEAMACGTPAIALDNTAFPEFAQGVALLLPDAEVETLTQGIQQVLTDSTLRSQMQSKGPEQAMRYDWHIITKQYVNLMLQTVASN